MMAKQALMFFAILGLATLLSIAGGGCTNVEKSDSEPVASAILDLPPATSPKPDAEFIFAETSPKSDLPDLSQAGVNRQVGQDSPGLQASESGPGANVTLVSDGEIAPRTVLHVKGATFDTEVLGSDVPVLVDFYADWCGPCKKLSPLLDQLAYQTENAKIVKVNIDHSPELAARYGVKGIPHLKVFKEGKMVAQHVGLANMQQLVSLLSPAG